MAADHRAASQALRDAEARACVGISDDDRDMSPVMHRDDIASVEPLNVALGSEKAQIARMEGAVLAFRAAPEMTAEWLHRIVAEGVGCECADPIRGNFRCFLASSRCGALRLSEPAALPITRRSASSYAIRRPLRRIGGCASAGPRSGRRDWRSRHPRRRAVVRMRGG
jgi:hypothetical protein